MSTLIKKNSLRDIFSKAAINYEIQARFQKKVCIKLWENIISDDIYPKTILDIGTGTGFFMQKLSKHFHNSQIVGFDFAFGMTKLAREKKLDVLQADAEFLPFKDESFDLIVSNLVFHWVYNLDNALNEVCRVLKEKGRFYFNLSGNQTLKEMRFCFEKNNSLKNEKEIKAVLERNNFKEIKINTLIFKEYFKDLFSLVGWLKSIGANRLTKPIFMGRETWQRANDIYLNNFKDNGMVFATFEVIEVSARK
ncbi:MAG: methyltransferase domain-containing protein [Candidatus Omnitrophota bacterium]|nr:methyltransferase domain-containing protein [Candidatus Omnitrophota bacterium]